LFRRYNPCYAIYERLLKKEILEEGVVEHVAIIQDGNRRFAKKVGISRLMGHTEGAKTTDLVADWCIEIGIKHLTLYAFSIENFSRSVEEKSHLFDLMRRKLLEMAVSERVHKNRVRVRAIGRTDMLPASLQEAIHKAEEATRGYSNLYFNVAMAYGGQCELVDAAKAIALEVGSGRLKADEIDEDLIARYLYPHNDDSVPKVDLIIRTGGDLRTSNFLPWQANGNECAAYFFAPYWPEFRKIDFMRAVRVAQARKAKV
jgi:tritrans,polycis-undecaprenyl-diphosphate synthase [geranylgeranyl-diphosphate specific]